MKGELVSVVAMCIGGVYLAWQAGWLAGWHVGHRKAIDETIISLRKSQTWFDEARANLERELATLRGDKPRKESAPS